MSFFQSSKPRAAPGHRPADDRGMQRGRDDDRDEDDQAEARPSAASSDQPRPSRPAQGGREKASDDRPNEQSRQKPPKPRLSGSRAARMAMQHLLSLTGQTAESLSGLTPTDGGWKVTLDIVELERIPRTTDVMASYEIELDEEGELIGYRRLGRYFRNQVDE